jgi:hypothetical protein
MIDELSTCELQRLFDALSVAKHERIHRSVILRSADLGKFDEDDPELYKICQRLGLSENGAVTLTLVEDDVAAEAILRITGGPVIIQEAEPPAFPAFLLRLFAKSPKTAEGAVGDMHERYVRDYAKWGPRRANLYCWADTLNSLWPMLRRALGRVVKAAALIEVIKRFLS